MEASVCFHCATVVRHSVVLCDKGISIISEENTDSITDSDVNDDRKRRTCEADEISCDAVSSWWIKVSVNWKAIVDNKRGFHRHIKWITLTANSSITYDHRRPFLGFGGFVVM